MKRLCVFMDGTWNVPKHLTNVSRLAALVAPVDPAGIPQNQKYVVGIGTDFTDRLRGAFGKGINNRVRTAYAWLAENFSPGDHIYVFGFSRGAFEARSLVGFLDRCGLSTKADVPIVAALFERYRRPDVAPNRSELASTGRQLTKDERNFLDRTRPVEVRFLGIWDTVRYLDIPYGRIRGFSRSENLFHEIMSTRSCRTIRQAIAIDEHRKPYRVEHFELSRQHAGSTDTEQRWFAGDHCDVGGGPPGGMISNVPLRWMQQEAASAGLHFKGLQPLTGDEHSYTLHDAYRRFLGGAFRVASARYYREIEKRTGIRSTIDASVLKRCREDRRYRPSNLRDWAKEVGCDLALQKDDFQF
ncbi:DUF2235 domain-containing protein [Bradyrhizobium commune]|uniref:DUF2235 domain-containing protein n=1 Tax=Bradyrhizobium commune TaxID=83627 RepID=A0A7S9GZ80_9BRAD|nr:DUF2235 domain-containing protein [Bradyrhizobium commune]QPF91243.1 DUF2235 domain-containing protein [Bradyrhizobium commune]